jgi:hypothetical protein
MSKQSARKSVKPRTRIAAFIGECVIRYHRTHSLTFARGATLRLGKTRCSGWCDDTNIKVATGSDFTHWLGVLAHESCHADQIRQDRKWFKLADQGLACLDAWLQGGKAVRVRKATLQSIRLEHDCEARSIAKIRRHKLPIDLAEYTQKANAYLLGYHVTLRERKWCFRAYRDKAIWGQMPTRLLPLNEVLKPKAELLSLFA